MISSPTATRPKTDSQVKRWRMGENSSLEDCQTNVCQAVSEDLLVARLVSGSGAKPMMDDVRPPCPSLGAFTQPGSSGVTSGISAVSARRTPVGRIGQFITMPRLSINIPWPVLPNRIGEMEGEKNSFASRTRCRTPIAS